jgi:hypothetical protein
VAKWMVDVYIIYIYKYVQNLIQPRRLPRTYMNTITINIPTYLYFASAIALHTAPSPPNSTFSSHHTTAYPQINSTQNTTLKLKEQENRRKE